MATFLTLNLTYGFTLGFRELRTNVLERLNYAEFESIGFGTLEL